MKQHQTLRRGLGILLSLVLCLSLLPATALAEGTESVTICGTTLEAGKDYVPSAGGGIAEKTEETAYLKYSSGTLTVHGSVTVALPASSTANVLKLESSELTISCPEGSSLTLDGQNSTAAAVSLQSGTLMLTGAGDVTIQGSETAVSDGTLKAESYSGDLAISAAGNSATVNNTVLNLGTTGNISITGSMPVAGGLLTVTKAADVTITGSVGDLLPSGSVITATGSISIESESNMVVNGLTVNNAEKVTLTGNTNGPVAMSVTLKGCESWDIINKSQTSTAPWVVGLTVDGTNYGSCYGVTVTDDGNGTASASPFVAPADTTITLTATANEGYRFKEWEVTPDTVTINDNQFTMPSANVTVKAIFEEDIPAATCDQTADFTTDAEAALALLNAAKTEGAADSTWNSESKILTLKGVDFTTSAQTAVKLPDGATIVLVDGTENTIANVHGLIGSSVGIEANGNITIQGSGTLTVMAGTAAQFSCGIYSPDGNVTIKGGTVTATGGETTEASWGSYGIDADGVTISGGTVTATGGEATGEESESYGICAYGDMDISGGTVTATGGNATGDASKSYGLYGRGYFENNEVIGGNITISGGTVKATGGNVDLYSDGIYADGAVTITGGTVTATGGEVTDEASESFGIESYDSETIIISGGHVIAQTLAGESATTRMALNAAPDLSSYTGYRWRTSASGDFTSSADTAYTYRESDTYVEFSQGAAPTTYTVRFDANGGSGEMDAVTGVSGSYTLPECGFTEPQGQHFAGWATSADGAVITDTTITVTGNTTLYAVWEDDASVSNGKAIQLGTTQIEGSQDGSVYFGNYKQSSNGSGIFNNDPIKWRVMSNKDGKLFLLADQNLDVKPYNNSNTSITWEKSTIRSWLNGYGASENNSRTDYSSNNFIGTAFSGKEQGAIAETSVYNATQSDGRSEPNPFHSISGGNNTTDKIFLLSIEEANKSSIALRKSTNTAYVANYSNMQAAGEADCWWLRSPGSLEDYAAFVATDGDVRYNGSKVDSTSFAVRPAFNLNLNAVLFTSAAVSGKSASGMDSGLTAVGNYTGSEWKLTLKDENRSEFTATTKTVASNKVTIEYSNAETGENEYISAILKDEDGNVNYYGRIAQLDGTTHGDSGTAEINLSGIDMTGKTLCVFNEQYNGDKKTDYASDFCPVNVTTYTISFDANGGSGSMTAGTVVPGSYTLPECGFTEPQGQHFAGWATSADGAVITDTTITVTGNTTLYAVWEDDASVSNGKAIQLGTSQILGGQAGSVYFGNYQQSSDGIGGFNNDPIKWRVLSNADGKLFLLADQNLDVRQFYNENISMTWEMSTIRSWLNGYEASENYSSDNFINTAFSDKEQSAISQTYVYNATKSDGTSNPNPDFELTSGNNTTDKVFLLSIEEAESSSNFPNGNSSRISTNTAYVANYSNMKAAGEANNWWLRTRGRYNNGAVDVGTDGKIDTWGGYPVNQTDIAVRPAFNLDLNAVLFTSAAVSGKSASGMDSGLTAVGNYTGSEWKLTLKDENRSEFTATTKTVASNKVTIEYSNAATGENEYISAIVKDAYGNVYNYGRIAQLDGTTNGASGTVEIDLSGIDMTDKTLCVFNEQYNGDKKTDYASNFCTVDITTYTISFDANGGIGEMTDVTDVSGSYTLPTTTTFTAPSGKQFAGWATSANGEVITGTTITVTEDITLYAVWAIPYGVTVNDDVAVTDLNKDDVLGNGLVRYDPDTNTVYKAKGYLATLTVAGNGSTDVVLGGDTIAFLTVTGAKNVTGTDVLIAVRANITCTGDVTFNNEQGSVVALTVNGAQNVTVISSASNAPVFNANATINCSGNVTISSASNMAMYGSLTVTGARDVTVTANLHNPAIGGAADITCSGDVTISNTGGGKAVAGNLTYQNASGKHSYTVKTGDSLENLTDYATKEAGDTFTATLDAAAVKITVAHVLTYVEAKAATCTEDGNLEHWACTLSCGKLFLDENGTTETTLEAVTIKAGHTADEWHSDSTQHWQVCTVCGEEFNRANHTFIGNTCTVCGYTKPSGGGSSSSGGGSSTPTYTPSVTQPENGTVTVSPKAPKKGDTVTITPKPEDGYTVEQILVTDKNGDPVKVTDNGDGTYSFTQPAGKVTVKATFMEDNSMLNFFVDVPAGAYYYDAVLWAAENGITGGVDDTHFAPNSPCTRAQIVTFLWRAAGSPEPETVSSFADVPADSYYAKAVAWAVENGITTGTGDGMFSPDATCTRAQAMAFIWRSQKSAAADGVNPFTDVAADAYYAGAVQWAVENGVTNGTSDTTFSPNTNCTRAQIVTFLFRCLGEE